MLSNKRKRSKSSSSDLPRHNKLQRYINDDAAYILQDIECPQCTASLTGEIGYTVCGHLYCPGCLVSMFGPHEEAHCAVCRHLLARFDCFKCSNLDGYKCGIGFYNCSLGCHNCNQIPHTPQPQVQPQPEPPHQTTTVKAESVDDMSDDSEVIECPICLEELPGRIAYTPCGHVYCADCLVRILDIYEEAACSYCRPPVKKAGCLFLSKRRKQ